MSSREPYLSIVRGDATPEETAALVAALAARAAARADRPAAPKTKRGNWRNPAHRLRVGLPHGPGAWRGAFFPGG
ncbi:acyl-CoA carboxylase subunit epsilon [Microbispora sp. NEAU-D428]|uniref:acyl-CoA carboxylase epsilon subunit n=1 Tax=Microbispora sitophila TaxID=2771537 RepID=UPI00186762B9|nr:acyl-CoA carboxylase epsilon subunit [Microbispora sitophila]MBE3008862.1 acyl-CoA carboxylase subunit epsilon [Microbispora sitophila]